MPVESYVPRVLPEVRAMRYEQGITTKRDILGFCPDADVGAPGDTHMDSTDLRWINVPTPDGGVTVDDGDYIAYFQITGYYRVFKPDEFHALYDRKKP